MTNEEKKLKETLEYERAEVAEVLRHTQDPEARETLIRDLQKISSLIDKIDEKAIVEKKVELENQVEVQKVSASVQEVETKTKGEKFKAILECAGKAVGAFVIGGLALISLANEREGYSVTSDAGKAAWREMWKFK